MANAYRIDMIGADNSRLPLGAVRAQAVQRGPVSYLPEGNSMVVMGEILPTPGADPSRLTRYSAYDRPIRLELSDEDEGTFFSGIFRIAAFDPHSHEALLWSLGDIQASPVT